jgi:hypothetical protein
VTRRAALVLGGTGRLAGVAAALVAEGWHVVVPSRHPAVIPAPPPPPDLAGEGVAPGAAARRALGPPGHRPTSEPAQSLEPDASPSASEASGSAVSGSAVSASGLPGSSAPGSSASGSAVSGSAVSGSAVSGEPEFAAWVAGDWSRPDELAAAVEPVLGGSVDLLVAAVSDEHRARVVHAVAPLLTPAAPVVEVHTAEPGAPVLAGRTHQVVLGPRRSAGLVRWPTTAEACDAVLATIRAALA